MNKTA